MSAKKLAGLALSTVLLCLAGCATDGEKMAERWIAEMDARPPEEQVPHWEHVRALMMREPPQVGDPAPDFELETREGDGTIRLSEFEPTKPVVLVFGSWT